jgi:hypothetical protein
VKKDEAVPMIYGDFGSSYLTLYNYSPTVFAKAILFNKFLLTYKYAYHDCYSDDLNSYLYKYIPGANNFMIMNADVKVKTNTQAGASIQLSPATKIFGSTLTGLLTLLNFVTGVNNNINDISNILDIDDTNYIILPVGYYLGVKIDGDISTSMTGMLNPTDDSIFSFRVLAMSATGSNTSMTVRYKSDRGYGTSYNHVVTTSQANYPNNFGTDTTNKPDSGSPWSLEEICSVEYVIVNTGTQAIRIYKLSIQLSGIKIQQFSRKIRIPGFNLIGAGR